MPENRTIYVDQLHNTAFRTRYRRQEIGAESLIELAGRETERLSGRWRFSIDPYDTALRQGWARLIEQTAPRSAAAGNDASAGDERFRPQDHDVDGWEQIPVPSCWNLIDPAWFWYEGSACYYRTFDLAEPDGERIFLYFEAVAGDAYVFVNGEQVAYHRGGSTPFCVEVSDTVRAGTNALFVVADNARSDDRVPMSNTDWFNYGGIYRDVHLVRTPRTVIRAMRVQLAAENSLSVQVDVDSSESDPPREARVLIPELGVDESVELAPVGAVEAMTPPDGAGSAGLRGASTIKATPERWSPEHPRLYEVMISCADDAVTDRIGFRTIERKGRRLLLNGEPLFLHGISWHEDDPDLGKSATEETIRRDLETARELGCNFVRLAHYPHSRAAARIADEIGLLLWEEIPVYWAIDFENDTTLADAKNQFRELIYRDRNRASVIVWSAGNENPDSDARLRFMSTLVKTARESDGSRLVSAACLYDHAENRISDRLAEHLDIIGINEYFGWYDPAYEKLPQMLENSSPDRPVILTEFGGGALAGHHGTVSELFTEERQREIYRRQIEAIHRCPYVKGMSPWILFDFRCPRRTNRFQRFYNRKGLLDADHRTRKLAFYELQSFYRGDTPGRLAREE